MYIYLSTHWSSSIKLLAIVVLKNILGMNHHLLLVRLPGEWTYSWYIPQIIENGNFKMPNFAAKWLLPFAVCDVQDSFGCFLKWWYPHFTPQVLIILSRKTEWVGWVPPTILGNHPTYMARVVPPSNPFHFMSTPRQGTARTNGHGLAPAIRPGAKGCLVGTWLSLGWDGWKIHLQS